jgi:hypothetical protein
MKNKNELIQNIADKHKSPDQNAWYYSIHPSSYESFAKDIIKECIQSIGGFQKGKMILDHFGLTSKDLENN